MSSSAQNFSTLAEKITATNQDWKARDVHERALEQLKYVDQPQSTEIEEAERRVRFADYIASRIARIDLDRVASEMTESHSTILHAKLGLGFWRSMELGLDWCHSMDRGQAPYLHRHTGMLEFGDLLEMSDAFKELKTQASAQGLYIGFQPLPVKGNSTIEWNLSKTQSVLTFSTEPLEKSPRGHGYVNAYSHIDYERGRMGYEQAVYSFNEKNIGPVVKIEDLAAPKPKQPSWVKRLMRSNPVEVYHITG